MKEILYFSATWCNPCKHFRPIMEQVSRELPVKFIDVDVNPDIATTYGVRSVPTLIFLKNGKLAAKQAGVLTESQVKGLWDQN